MMHPFSCQSDAIKFHDNILVVVKHPDDETLIIGTLAKLVARGYPVTVTYVTSGDDGQGF
jgi:LmbE family N-acetylglucosaminyl deacetylase